MTEHTLTGVREDLPSVLREALDPVALRAELQDGALRDAPQEIADRCLATALKVATTTLDSVDAIPMLDEQHRAVACTYLELKAQWIQRNVRLSYEGFTKGTWDAETAADAAVIGTLIQRIEPLIDPDHVRQIHELFVTQLPD